MKRHPVPPMLTHLVHTALLACDRTEYHVQGPCRYCGGSLSGYDTRTKRFAILCDDNGEQYLHVIVHRAYCRDCGRIVTPEDPFYPGTRIGAPVVDLCRAFAGTIPYSRVSTRLDQMGVRVDRWSVRSYVQRPHTTPQTIAVFGMMIPVSIIALSALSGTVGEGNRPGSEDVLAACSLPGLKTPSP
jgi:hypothetical protein